MSLHVTLWVYRDYGVVARTPGGRNQIYPRVPQKESSLSILCTTILDNWCFYPGLTWLYLIPPGWDRYYVLSHLRSFISRHFFISKEIKTKKKPKESLWKWPEQSKPRGRVRGENVPVCRWTQDMDDVTVCRSEVWRNLIVFVLGQSPSGRSVGTRSRLNSSSVNYRFNVSFERSPRTSSLTFVSRAPRF